MTKKEMKALLQCGKWSFLSKPLIKRFGLETAVIIGHFCSLQVMTKRSWFVCTHEEIEDVLDIKLPTARKAVKILKETGIMQAKRKGMPCKTFYKLNFKLIHEIMEGNTLKPEKMRRTTKPPIYKETDHNTIYIKENKEQLFNNNLIGADAPIVDLDKEINSILSFWNKQPNAIKHEIKASSKTYQKIHYHLSNLLYGRPIVCKKNEEATYPLLTFIEKNKLPEKMLTCFWSSEDIKAILQNLACRSKKKLALLNLLWNPFAGGGYCAFYLEAVDKQVERKYILLSAELHEAIGKEEPIYAPRLLEQWAKDIKIKDLREVFRLIAWWGARQGEQFSPTVYSVYDFIEKYPKIKVFKQRKTTEESPNGKNIERGFGYLNQERQEVYRCDGVV